MSGIKYGVVYHSGLFGIAPEQVTALARHAEQCGFESFFTTEHIALYPGVRLGREPIAPDTPIADPLEVLSFVAAVTERLLLGTGVMLLPYHQPVVLAKRLATIDQLSRGRMRLFGIGVGALDREAEAAGVDFHTRGRRADEALDVLRLLWAGGADGVSYDGEFYSFRDLCVYPKPYQASTLPIQVGGSSSAAARRAGLRGDGYFPGGGLTAADREAQVALMRQTAREAGRDADALQYTRWGSVTLSVEEAADLTAEGVTRVVVSPTSADLAEQQDQLSAFAERHGLS
jgi:probable F420-dependent oxidoreductase